MPLALIRQTEGISIANRNFASAGKIYSGHVKPIFIDMQFQVASSDSAGLGITGLKGAYVTNVFMHTSATPGSNNSLLNPNPASGTIIVQLNDNYSGLYSMNYSIISPNSASDVKIDNSAMTAGVAYVITTLGNATAAKWHLIGVPAGVTPAVGVSFIAASNGGAGNSLTSRVQTSAAAGSNIFGIELVGTPNQSIAPLPTANQGYGASFILQCRKSTSDASAIAAPADGSIIQLRLVLSDSSVLVGGW